MIEGAEKDIGIIPKIVNKYDQHIIDYCSSKAGLNMTILFGEDRLSEYGINVYEVCPGIIQTDKIKSFMRL